MNKGSAWFGFWFKKPSKDFNIAQALKQCVDLMEQQELELRAVEEARERFSLELLGDDPDLDARIELAIRMNQLLSAYPEFPAEQPLTQDRLESFVAERLEHHAELMELANRYVSSLAKEGLCFY